MISDIRLLSTELFHGKNRVLMYKAICLFWQLILGMLESEYPRLYDRVLTDFRLPDGSTVQAWIYIMNTLPEQAKAIVSGDWKAR